MLDLISDEGAALGSLIYDYSQVDDQHRDIVMTAAIDIKTRWTRAQDDLIVIGQQLIDIKQFLPHGQFGKWVAQECGIEPRMAQNMMNVAERFADKSETVSLLSNSVVMLLAAPSVPDEAIEEVVVHAREIGASPTKTEAKAIIDAHKPPKRPAPPSAVNPHKVDHLVSKGWAFIHKPDGSGVSAVHGALTGVRLVPFATEDEAIDFAEAKQKEAGSPTPTLRTLTADETMSLVWRVVKAAKMPIATSPATTGQRWRQYRDWLSRYTVAADYSHEAPAGTQLDRQTLAGARQAIVAELDKNINMVHAPASEPAVEAPVGKTLVDVFADEAVQLPPFPVADKEMFIAQVKRSIKLLDEEGCATVAGFLRAVARGL